MGRPVADIKGGCGGAAARMEYGSVPGGPWSLALPLPLSESLGHPSYLSVFQIFLIVSVDVCPEVQSLLLSDFQSFPGCFGLKIPKKLSS